MKIFFFLVLSLSQEIISLKKILLYIYIYICLFKYTFHKDYELSQEPVAGADLLMRKPQPGSSEDHCVLGQAYNYPSKQRSLNQLPLLPSIIRQQGRMHRLYPRYNLSGISLQTGFVGPPHCFCQIL